jgi:putative transposase
MPVPKNKPTTLSPDGSTLESSSNVAPDQEEFRQHLRRLAVSAVQVLIEHVMREELEQCIGASWGECTRHQPWVPQWVLHPRSRDPHWAH